MKKVLQKSCFLLGLGISVVSYGQDTSKNFVKSTECLNNSCSEKKEAVTYYDGLGRENLSIVIGAGNSATTGLATKITYDGFGRVDKEFLPGVISNLNYGEPSYSAYGSEAAYSQKEYENSPLNRVLKQAAPGNSWKLGSGNEIKFDYQTNGSNEVKMFEANTTYNNSEFVYDIKLRNYYNNLTYYQAGTLYKTITKDENWTSGKNNTIEEFKDKEGRVILKRTYSDVNIDGRIATEVKHDTYYVYDIYGNLTFVLPPKLSDFAEDQNKLRELIGELGYQYKYDSKNRLVEKKLPGKGWEYMVYDRQDRLVGTQDELLRKENKWLFTKYDKFNRVSITGFVWDPGKRVDVQYHIENVLGTSTIERSSSGYTQDNIKIYYTTNGFGGNNHVLTVNYYDDYPSYGTDSSTRNSEVQGHTLAKGNQLKGLPTLSIVRNLNTWENNQPNFEYNYTYYEDKDLRVVKTHKINYLGGYTTVENKLDFRGKPLLVETKHKRKLTDTELKTSENFAYDHFERLKTHTHQINSGAVEVLTQNIYNSIGQLSNKKVGNTVSSPLQWVKYNYNIRGWLTNINDYDNWEDINNSLFAFQINYDKKTSTFSNQADPLFNGNISQTIWKTANSIENRSYDYTYDGLNRLKAAYYSRGNAIKDAYNENLTYDKNGNILTLARTGQTEINNGYSIDNLSYAYKANSNQLLSVTDSRNGAVGFIDGNKTGDDYDYDDNGNLTKDLNKGITDIKYNHLNLPEEVIWNSTKKIAYSYDATGIKLKKIVIDGSKITTTDYLDGFQYQNEKLQFFPTTEGYVNVLGSTLNNQRTFHYVYNYTDHLGNVRVSYAWDSKENKLKILEDNHYYPFGMEHRGYKGLVQTPGQISGEIKIDPNPTTPTEYSGSSLYNYKYNGKELQEEFNINLYDYGARNYDPSIGRWMNVDPLAEVSRRFSPYVYALNNPVFFIDPDGMMAEPPKDYNGDSWTDETGTYTKWGGIDNSYVKNGDKSQVYDTSTETYSSVVNVTDSESSGFLSLPQYIKNAYDNSYNPAYSPYSPDAVSFGVSGSVNSIFFNANISISIAITGGDVALVVGGDSGLGLNVGTPGFSLGVNHQYHDNYGGNTDVLGGLGGTDISKSIGVGVMGTYSTSADIVNGQPTAASQGVNSYGIGSGTGFGASISQAESFKLSNGINNISQGLSTMKNTFLQAVTPPSILR